jgi:hypothetical protein
MCCASRNRSAKRGYLNNTNQRLGEDRGGALLICSELSAHRLDAPTYNGKPVIWETGSQRLTTRPTRLAFHLTYERNVGKMA